MRTSSEVPKISADAWLESTPRDNATVLLAELTKTPFTIGRSFVCDLTIESTRISREHVRIERCNTGFRVIDLGSTNGTFLNGVRIAEAPLVDGDLLALANFGLIFHFPVSCLITNSMARGANA